MFGVIETIHHKQLSLPEIEGHPGRAIILELTSVNKLAGVLNASFLELASVKKVAGVLNASIS